MISNAYRVDFDKIEEQTGIYIERDEDGNPSDEAKNGVGDYLQAGHGFFNPKVISDYHKQIQENESLPRLEILMHDKLLKTQTHTGTIVTNAGHNQYNWEIVPSELRAVLERQLGNDFNVAPNIGLKRDDCWQVDLSNYYLFGGNPKRALQELQSKIERIQTDMLVKYTGGRYKGDHWKSSEDTTSSNQAVLSMDLDMRSDVLWEKAVKPKILHQILNGATTIAIADGATNYFVPDIREMIEDFGLQGYIRVISYPEELQKCIEAQDTKSVYLLATRDGLEMGKYSIFSNLMDVAEVKTPEDSMKEIPLMVDDPNRPGKEMRDPTGKKREVVDKKNTATIKIGRIEKLLKAIKDTNGQSSSEHEELLRNEIAWIPDGETVVLGATELELLFLDDNLRKVFEERNLQVISPLLDLVAPAVAAASTNITQPPVGKYRDESIPDAPNTPSLDHEDIVAYNERIAKIISYLSLSRNDYKGQKHEPEV